MLFVTTNAYKTLIARAVMGESGLDLLPKIMKIGNGATFNGDVPNPAASTDTDLTNSLSSVTITPTRSGFRVNATGTIPGSGTSTTINEVGFFTNGGVMIGRATFPNSSFVAPASFSVTLNLQAEYS